MCRRFDDFRVGRLNLDTRVEDGGGDGGRLGLVDCWFVSKANLYGAVHVTAWARVGCPG